MHSVPTQKNHSQLQWVKCLLETAHDTTFVSSEADALKDIQKGLLRHGQRRLYQMDWGRRSVLKHDILPSDS